MDTETEYIAALIHLHQGLDRQGPGDQEFSRRLLDTLPSLPPQPRIADLGCGSGAGALLLAEVFQSPVKAVDLSPEFLQDLSHRAQHLGLDHLITPICGDMAQLDWPGGSLDLLWSEGAAYNLEFEQALTIWRPLLTDQGVAVVSELSWFTNAAPEAAIAYWQQAYPTMATESENRSRAIRAGFRVNATHRLPSQAWWVNYYDPLRQRINQIERTPTRNCVIQEIETEITLFEHHSDHYGYTFYVLQAASDSSYPTGSATPTPCTEDPDSPQWQPTSPAAPR